MASRINADSSNGLQLVSDSSGEIQFQSSGITKATLNSSGFSSPGNVLQVVQGTSYSQDSTTGNTFIASNLSASITPSSTSSKILIQVSSVCTNTGNGQGNYTIYRGATNLSSSAQNTFNQYFSSSGYSFVPITMVYLDSPSTTSSTTYAVYFKTSSGSTTTYFGSANIEQTITLMEIAG